ncbi:hypothetical protein Emag_006333 [Eimeria magna]
MASKSSSSRYACLVMFLLFLLAADKRLAATPQGTVVAASSQALLSPTAAAPPAAAAAAGSLIGSRVRVGVTSAGTGEAEVVTLEAEQTKLRLTARHPAKQPWERIELDLLLAMPRPKVLERIVQVCATLGVRRIFMICADRTERGFLSSSRLASNNLVEQLILGLEQGMLTRPPELHTFASWEGFLAATDAAAEAARVSPDGEAAAAATTTAAAPGNREIEGDVAAAAAAKAAAAAAAEDNETESWSHYLLPPLRLVAHPHTPFTLPALLLRQFSEAQNGEGPVQQQQQQQQQQLQQQQHHQRVGVLLAIGPEGGWVPSEMKLLQQQLRCLPFRLTDKVLKCETALVACITQLTLCAEDLMFLPLLRTPEEVYEAAAAAAAAAASATSAAADAAATTAAAADAGAAGANHKVDKRKHRGGREVLRLAGGILMSFPQRYITRAAAAAD